MSLNKALVLTAIRVLYHHLKSLSLPIVQQSNKVLVTRVPTEVSTSQALYGLFIS